MYWTAMVRSQTDGTNEVGRSLAQAHIHAPKHTNTYRIFQTIGRYTYSLTNLEITRNTFRKDRRRDFEIDYFIGTNQCHQGSVSGSRRLEIVSS